MMIAMTIEVDEETQRRVERASLDAGVSLATFTRDALLSRLEDLEDEREAADVLSRLEKRKEDTITLEEKRHMQPETPAALDLLVTRFPATFFPPGTTPQPLKLGIHKDLIAALGDEAVGKKAIRSCLLWYTRRPGYLKALVERGQRVDLKGVEIGPVSDEHRKKAKAMLTEGGKPKSSGKTPGEARVPKPAHP